MSPDNKQAPSLGNPRSWFRELNSAQAGTPKSTPVFDKIHKQIAQVIMAITNTARAAPYTFFLWEERGIMKGWLGTGVARLALGSDSV